MPNRYADLRLAAPNQIGMLPAPVDHNLHIFCTGALYKHRYFAL
ncbi:hypothetical protein [Yoonia sp. BS5-3]|uniref:Uncharacterized protein n=1 Tax=Yoonia phaeophyticola TaxID=3137369 RepID=A0ABZ2V0R9_9RHOB